MEDELARALAASERTHALEESRRNSAEEAALKEALALSLNDAAPPGASSGVKERVSRTAATCLLTTLQMRSVAI